MMYDEQEGGEKLTSPRPAWAARNAARIAAVQAVSAVESAAARAEEVRDRMGSGAEERPARLRVGNAVALWRAAVRAVRLAAASDDDDVEAAAAHPRGHDYSDAYDRRRGVGARETTAPACGCFCLDEEICYDCGKCGGPHVEWQGCCCCASTEGGAR